MPKLVKVVRKQKWAKFIRGRNRYTDKDTLLLTTNSEKLAASKEFHLAGINWTLSTDRYDITEENAKVSYVAVKVEPKLAQGKNFRIKANGSLRIRHNSNKISAFGFNPDPAPEIVKDFDVILSPAKKFYLEKKLLLQSQLVGKKSPLTDWTGDFVIELEMKVVSIFVGQFPAINFKVRTDPSQIQVRVPKKTARSETGVPDMVDFYCAKEILAFHSLHFKTLFYAEGAEGFTENQENRIILKHEDISPKGFKNFLEILHACEAEVSVTYVEELLGFAEYSVCPIVTGHCESFLLSRKAYMVGLDYKLQLADRFKLHTLRAFLMRRLTLKEPIVELLGMTKPGAPKKITLNDETIAILDRRAASLPTREEKLAAWKKKKEERVAKRKRKGKKTRRS